MAMKQTLEIYELLDRPDASGHMAAELLRNRGLAHVTVGRVQGPQGYTEFVKAVVPGSAQGKTLGVIGRRGEVEGGQSLLTVTSGLGKATREAFVPPLASPPADGKTWLPPAYTNKRLQVSQFSSAESGSESCCC